MDELLEKIGAMLTESTGEEQSTQIVEAMTKFQEKAKADAIKEAEEGIQARVDEAVQEKTIALEADYLQKLDDAKAEADKAVQEDVKTYEGRLAQRVKSVLEDAVEQHGDRLVRVAEEAEAKEGSKLFESMEAVFDKHKREISEAAQANPEEVDSLKKQVATLEGEVAKANKLVLDARARANVAEQNLQTLREQADEGANVVVEDAEPNKGTPAAHVTEDEGGNGNGDNPVNENKQYSPAMQRMRKLASIG